MDSVTPQRSSGARSDLLVQVPGAQGSVRENERMAGQRSGKKTALRVSVIVATFGRPRALQNCLLGIEAQTHRPDEVIVVFRDDDEATAQVVDLWRGRVRVVTVGLPGVVQALRAGAAVAVGDVVAIADDDAVPRPDWLQGLLTHYRDARVVAVGGRDVVHAPGGPLGGSKGMVGVLTRYGRCLGNHHLGSGGWRRVDILKGANCSYRREHVAFPLGLRGTGAVIDNDLATSLYAGSFGAVIYDPDIVVDHYPDVRAAGDVRDTTLVQASHASFNRSLAVGTLRPRRRGVQLAYALIWGERRAPGILQCSLRDHGRTARLCCAAMTGAIAGTWTSIVRPLHMCQPADQAHVASCTAGLVKQ